MKPSATAFTGCDDWLVAESGLNTRVTRRLLRNGITTIGELRKSSKKFRLGSGGQRHVQWFLDWTGRLESGKSLPSSLPSWLAEFLTTAEVFVVEQRYGLTDPLFRPQMKRRTLREIGETRSLTRERARQILKRTLTKLRSRLAQATLSPVAHECSARIAAAEGVVTSTELTAWRGAAWLSGHQPWGTLLLLSEVTEIIHRRYDYFSTLPEKKLEEMEQRLVQAVERAGAPVEATKIAGDIPARVASIVLDRHPGVDATRDGSFFLFPSGAKPLLDSLTGNEVERVAQYNELVAPHSRREARELERCCS